MEQEFRRPQMIIEFAWETSNFAWRASQSQWRRHFRANEVIVDVRVIVYKITT